MSVPYRKWLQFDEATLECKSLLPGFIQSVWTDKHRSTCRIGKYNPIEWMMNHWWYSIFRPVAGVGFESLSGMDQIVDVRWDTNLIKIANHEPLTSVDLTQGFVGNSNRWSPSIVSGKYYDGSNAWDSYPPPQIAGYNPTTIELHAQWYSEYLTTYMYSWKADGGNGVEANRYQDDFFRNGAYFKMDLMAGLSPGNKCTFTLRPELMTVRYFNPVVNKCLVNDVERYWVPTTGGIEFKLVGLGFKNNDAELDGEGDSRGGWNDLVTKIEFWKQQYAAMAYWRDEFADTALEAGWTAFQTDAQRTIVEASGVLTYTIDDGTDALWSGYGGAPKNLGPRIYRTLDATPPCEIITKLNSTSGNDGEFVGIFIATTPEGMGDGDAYLFGLAETHALGRNFIVMNVAGGAFLAWTEGPYYTTPQWLKIAIDSSGVITFWRSETGLASSWTQMAEGMEGTPYSLSNYYTEGIKVGLFASNNRDYWQTDQAVSAPFEFFEVNSGGSPFAILKEADGDFTVDSNVQITIPSGKFPNLEEGTYILRVIKEGMDFSPRNSDVDVWGWAGDWRCALDGLVREGVRFAIEARDAPPATEPREKGDSIILMEVGKKDPAGNVTKEYYSAEDVRCPDKFYEGVVLEIASFKRGLDDKTGLFNVADCSMKLANHDKKFSKLLASYDFDGQIATLYHAFTNEYEYDKREIVKMVVEDYNIKGVSFEMILKDVSQKFFKFELPMKVCNEIRFPRVHDSYVDATMPDILGVAKVTGGKEKGAVEAPYIDTEVYRYLAAEGQLHSITEVYSDNVKKTLDTHYTISHGDRRTYIKFESDQEDKKITFNCEGYEYAGWNSVNGFVQNPAYIAAYILMVLLEIPLDFIDYGSVEEVAEMFVDMGKEFSGKLIIQDQTKAMEVFRELLFTFGIKCWISKAGKFTFGRKDIATISSEAVLFEQQDIIDGINRKMGLKDAVTGAMVYWDYIPVQDRFKGSQEFDRNDYEGGEEPGETYDEDEDEYIKIPDDEFTQLEDSEDDSGDSSKDGRVGRDDFIGRSRFDRIRRSRR